MPTQDTDYYALLGVDPGAATIAIRKALVREQRLWGLRQNANDPGTRQDAERRVQLLVTVADVLLKPSTVRSTINDRPHSPRSRHNRQMRLDSLFPRLILNVPPR